MTSSLLAVVFVLCAVTSSVQGREIEVTFRIEEQQRAGTSVGNIAKEIARDLPVGATNVRYNFLKPHDTRTSQLFSLQTQTGQLTTNAMIDRETVCDTISWNCVIELEVMVQPGNAAEIRLVKVKVIVEDINDNTPQFPQREVTVDIPESVLPGEKYSITPAVDRDTGPINKVNFYEIEPPYPYFDVEDGIKLDGSSELKLVVKQPLDREQEPLHRFTVLAKDNGLPQRTGTLTVIVNVTDINDNPPAFHRDRYDVDVRENTPVNQVVYRVSASDLDIGVNGQVVYTLIPVPNKDITKFFELSASTGDLIVRAPLQYETGDVFSGVVEAKDRGSPAKSSQAMVNIRVTDEGNTPPKLDLKLREGDANDVVVLSEATDVNHPLGILNVIDRDSGKNGDVTCWPSDSHFKLEKYGNEGKDYFIQLQEPLDRETRALYNVTLACQDAGSPRLTASKVFVVKVSDVNDEAPVFSRPSYSANITEDNHVGLSVLRVSATDRDEGMNAEIHYELTWNADSLFTIDRNSGVIRANSVFDRETFSQMSFTVKAVDAGNPAKTGTASVEVNILDKNDNPPYLTHPKRLEVVENSPPGTVVGVLAAEDLDVGKNAEVRFSLNLTDHRGPPFNISADGTVRVASWGELDRESQGAFRLTVKVENTVTDGLLPLYSYDTVTIIVLDINDNPPHIIFPRHGNDSVTILSDITPGSQVTRVIAEDIDSGKNATMEYHIDGSGYKEIFDINRQTGDIFLRRWLTVDDKENYKVKVYVRDMGTPQLQSEGELNIHIYFTNATLARGSIKDAEHKYVIIAGIVAGITVIISIIVVTVILQLRRSDDRHRHHPAPMNDKSGIQEESGKTEFQVKVHADPEEEDLKAGFGGKGEKGGNGHTFENKHGKDASFLFDAEKRQHDGYLNHDPLDQYSKQEFYTFRKPLLCPKSAQQGRSEKTETRGRPANEDINSDASGETTASDSGRGGSEDDIPLPPVPELTEYEGRDKLYTVALNPETMHPKVSPRDRRHNPTVSLTSLPLTTFQRSPGSGGDPVTPSQAMFQDIHRLAGGSELLSTTLHTLPHPHSSQARRSPTPTGTVPREALASRLRQTQPKQVTFASDSLATKLRDWSQRCGGNSPVLGATHAPYGFTGPGSYAPLPVNGNNNVNNDDDDNTTTSGSYTLNPEELEDSFIDSRA